MGRRGGWCCGGSRTGCAAGSASGRGSPGWRRRRRSSPCSATPMSASSSSPAPATAASTISPRPPKNIVERYENSLTAQKGVHGRRILEKTKGKDFHVPKETTDKGPGKDFHVPKETTDKGSNDDDMRSIDETDISTLNMDQLSQIERLLEDELRWTRERKVVVDRSARLEKKVRGRAAIVEVEGGSMEIPKYLGRRRNR